jgi:type I restriction enzyme S subunit
VNSEFAAPNVEEKIGSDRIVKSEFRIENVRRSKATINGTANGAKRLPNSLFTIQNSQFDIPLLLSLADSPERVAKLRQTILSLAVSGQFNTQNAADEPADALLKQIAEERQRRISRRELTPEPRFKASELPSLQLPFGWRWARLGEVTFCRDGERVPVCRADREHVAKTYAYYGASGVIDKIDRYLFDKALLLIGEDGANLINRSTPIAFIAEGKYWVNNHAHVLDALNRTLLEYLRLYINSISLEPYITGMAQPKMNQAQMNSIPVPLPPLAEQHRIVAKVEQLLALCDELEERLKRAEEQRIHIECDSLAHLSEKSEGPVVASFDVITGTPDSTAKLREKLIALAVSGGLSSDQTKAVALQKPLRGCISLTSGQHLTPSEYNSEERGIPYITGPADFGPRYPTISRWTTQPKACALQGDILITVKGAGVGKINVCDAPETAISRQLMAARPKNGDLGAEYLELSLHAAFRSFQNLSNGIAIPGISRDDVLNHRVWVPPVEEQHAILNKVRQLLAFCADLDRAERSERHSGERLFNALLNGLGRDTRNAERERNA